MADVTSTLCPATALVGKYEQLVERMQPKADEPWIPAFPFQAFPFQSPIHVVFQLSAVKKCGVLLALLRLLLYHN